MPMEIGLVEILIAAIVLLVVLGTLYVLLQREGDGEMLELLIELVD
ncbi:hypothetical protein SY89_00542 [Halolamina pelagica]|uniref:Uncharacterized protein n=1 Tax=Halolamina pelagica TaxID=699431 RepID=A0A0P7G936_9EURY|nr:hypothetical protein [Halolamina pelagica]KPN29824.1 hypothetical protein SY89_00542 [Halolamina pelagica]